MARCNPNIDLVKHIFNTRLRMREYHVYYRSGVYHVFYSNSGEELPKTVIRFCQSCNPKCRILAEGWKQITYEKEK